MNPRAATTVTGRNRWAGYTFAVGAGTLWGTTGPLSTALYAEGAQLTDVGFWRILLSLLGLAAFGLARPSLFRIDRRGLLIVAGLGGLLVALFEVFFQVAITGIGVAPAVALLYTAPVTIAILAQPLLGERLTATRIALAVVVMIGVALTVNGHAADDPEMTRGGLTFAAGVLGGLVAAASYAGSTLVARYAVPRYGSVRVLFFELLGGTAILAAMLPLTGHAPTPAQSVAGWLYIMSLGLGAVLGANFCYFAAVRRIDAAPASVGASVEPVVGAILALLLFDQRLSALGWIGLCMVVGGVATGYRKEAAEQPAGGEPGHLAVGG